MGRKGKGRRRERRQGRANTKCHQVAATPTYLAKTCYNFTCLTCNSMATTTNTNTIITLPPLHHRNHSLNAKPFGNTTTSTITATTQTSLPSLLETNYIFNLPSLNSPSPSTSLPYLHNSPPPTTHTTLSNHHLPRLDTATFPLPPAHHLPFERLLLLHSLLDESGTTVCVCCG